MNEILRNRLLALGAASAVAIAGVLTDFFEGVRYTPYRDPAGIWTVCRGVTGPDVIQGKTYTQAECDEIEQKHLRIAEVGVKRQITTYEKLNPWQQAALIDFAYNAGEGNLQNSTLRRKFNVGDVTGGCKELVKWVNTRVNGQLVALPGLVKRRSAELDLCLNWGSASPV